MDDLFKPEEKKRGINKVFLGALLIGVVAIGAVIALLSLKPSMEVQTAKILEGSFRPGSAEFDDLQKDIIISTDDKTVQSPMATGKISMFINGKIRNKGTKTITVLEVNVAVVTQFNDVLRERRILVVPVQQPSLAPGEIIPITLTLDGFDRSDDPRQHPLEGHGDPGGKLDWTPVAFLAFLIMTMSAMRIILTIMLIVQIQPLTAITSLDNYLAG